MMPQKVDELQTWATKTEVRMNAVDTKFDRIMDRMDSLLEVKKSVAEIDRALIEHKERIKNVEAKVDALESLRLSTGKGPQ
jgi:archaellum component FlaC